MSLLSSLLGNASEIDIDKVQLEPALVSGGGEPIAKEFKKGTDVVGIQNYLAYGVFGGAIKKGGS